MTADQLYAVIEATWPPAATRRDGDWTLRDGAGGGKRVSAATLDGAGAWDAQSAQSPALVMVRAGEDRLDAVLAGQGYAVADPTVAYACPVAALTGAPLPPVSSFALWPPLAIQRDLWAEGGIGPERVAVMERAGGPRAAILARHNDQPAGTGFVAIHDNVAMIHAIEVTPAMRRQGVGANILRRAALWAQHQGATTLALLVTRANAPANALYSSLGMQIVGHYHYRTKEGA
ncbi:Histone acetyltransferase HPA2 [Candidatus Rhodobacter oscarellae]|uniref:Histone acetyltransferase HPA2 n=1 Tax=Candidatus Rhodobacter oscarellae TaxID=1675527 RepID=A0A0J9EAL7_9RHOB|nr:GNAT family N-acetyltransferase [Candidatus Rhodobacter lobularis]KMW58704.1 Histone acetyltransferase HPA2 [Candidatus Rhodobacter lobularis]